MCVRTGGSFVRWHGRSEVWSHSAPVSMACLLHTARRSACRVQEHTQAVSPRLPLGRTVQEGLESHVCLLHCALMGQLHVCEKEGKPVETQAWTGTRSWDWVGSVLLGGLSGFCPRSHFSAELMLWCERHCWSHFTRLRWVGEKKIH